MKKADDYDPSMEKVEPVRVGRNLISGENLGARWLVNATSFVAGVLLKPAWITDLDMVDEDDSADESTEAPMEAGHPIQISALDTPGLDDSMGEDDAHIEQVIVQVLEMKTLCGLIMVSKCGCPITPAWQAQVLRYWKLFPMLRSQWVFVHTKSDPMAVGAKERRSKGSFESMAVLTGDKEFSGCALVLGI